MKKLLLILFMPLLSQAMEEKKTEIKTIFVDSKLEDNVRLFTNKKTDEKLDREDYVLYLKTMNKDMINTGKYVICFLGSVRGTAIEVMKKQVKE